MGASGREVPEREGMNLREAKGPSTPSGEPFGEWLDRQVRGGRLGKDRSGPAMSSAHYAALDDIKRELRRRYGYSPREVSYGNLVEIAIDLLREHVLERAGAKRLDRPTVPRRPGGR